MSHRNNNNQQNPRRRRRNSRTVGRRALSSLQAVGGYFLPQRQTVILESQWTGYIAAGGVGTSGNFASFLPTSIYQPFTTTTANTLISAVSTLPFNGVSSGGASIANSPIGYTYLSTNYESYKVLDYEVIMTVTPQNSADTVAMAMAPLGDQEQPTTGNWSFFKMSGQRYARSGRATNGANSRLNSMRYSGPAGRDIGYTREQWLNFPMQDMGSNQSTYNTVDFFGVMLQSVDGGTNGSPVVIDIVLRQKVLVTDPVQYGA